MVEMQMVQSSNVEAIGYDEGARELHVRFRSDTGPGRKYVYYDVEEWVYQEFLNAPSKGGYLHDHIKGRYDYREV